MKRDYLKIHSKSVEDYLAGKRENPMICTNDKIAKQLEKKYNVKMIKEEVVNKENGLYMFEIK